MSAVLDMRAAMVSTIKAAVPALRSVESHRGRFDSTAEIKRYAVRAPAVLVACSGFRVAAQSGGILRIAANWSWFILTRDTPTATRDAYALTLVETLSGLIEDADWGLPDALTPGPQRADNLYAGTIDQLGVAVWALGFTQALTVDRLSTADYAALGAFITFHADVDVAPADGQIDITETDTLPQ